MKKHSTNRTRHFASSLLALAALIGLLAASNQTGAAQTGAAQTGAAQESASPARALSVHVGEAKPAPAPEGESRSEGAAVGQVAESSHYAWEEEPNELPAQANALAAGGGRQGFAGVGDPTGITVYYFDGDHDGIEDLFAVTLTQSAPLELTLTSTGGADLDLFLFSASGSQLTLLGSSNGSTGNERIATNGPLAAGRYYVGVSAYRGASAYTLAAAGPQPWPTATIEIIPANPSSNDNISVRVSGEAGSPCSVPINPQISLVGSEVRVTLTEPGGGFCPQVITPWAYTLPVGRLQAGSYQATVTLQSANGSTRQLAQKSFTVASAAPAFTLAASPVTVAPGGGVAVCWTAPSGRPASDWIGLFAVGAPNTSYGLGWRYTGGASSGCFTFRAPAQPGRYEFRYLLNGGYNEAARSNVFTVTAGQSHTLVVGPQTVAPGRQLGVCWTAPAGSSPYDWVALYAVGDANTSYWRGWQYTRGETSGCAVFTAPTQPGRYEFRYLLNNGYSDAVRSQTVTVSADQLYALTVTPAVVAPGGSVSVCWTAPNGRPTSDWIGLFAVGDPSTSYHRGWRYTGGAASGCFTFTAPTQPGRYEFRYLLNGGYNEAAWSIHFQVR
jgi:hypothetical protein